MTHDGLDMEIAGGEDILLFLLLLHLLLFLRRCLLEDDLGKGPAAHFYL